MSDLNKERMKATVAALRDSSSGGKGDNVEATEKLGEGSFGDVYRLKEHPEHILKVPKIDKYNKRGFVEDGDIICYDLQKKEGLSTEGLVRIDDIGKDYVIMECCDDGDLEQLGERDRSRAAELLRGGGALNIMNGINNIHGCNYVHRDIKPDNILCTAEGKFKIGDFGFMGPNGEQNRKDKIAGTPMYYSPEKCAVESFIDEGMRFDEKRADCWAAGCVLYNILCGKDIGDLVCEVDDMDYDGTTFTSTMIDIVHNESCEELRSKFKEIMLKDLDGAGVGSLMQFIVGELLNPDQDTAQEMGEILEMVEEMGKEEKYRVEYEAMKGTEKKKEEKKEGKDSNDKKKGESDVESVTKTAAVSALKSSCHTVNENVNVNNISSSQGNPS
ncbi:MAG: protein kinase, partial [Rickettsiales bacterium]|nr:protein kinase [Rickettsiales bacterium]